TLYKYLAKTVKDGGGIPAAVPSSYKMISNTSGGTDCPALAFSSVQFTDVVNPNHRLHAVYTHRGSGGYYYSLMYKNKHWPSASFRPSLMGEENGIYAVAPNPFRQELNITVPQDDQ